MSRDTPSLPAPIPARLVFLCLERPHSYVLRLGTIAHPIAPVLTWVSAFRAAISSHGRTARQEPVTIRWTPSAATSACRFMHDQDGRRAIGAAVTALAEDPLRAKGFHRGRYHRLRVGSYRILYVIDDDMITVERVDRVPDGCGLAPEFQ